MDHSGHSMDHSGHSMDHSSMDHSGHGMDHSMNTSDIMDMNNTIGSHFGHHIGLVNHQMAMYFHFAVNDTILFQNWQPATTAGLIGSMIGIFLIALFYEGLKYFREYLIKKMLSSSTYNAAANKPTPNQDRPVQFMDHIIIPAPTTMMSGAHIIQTFLHMFQLIISYCLMLIFMTYNVWLCIAVTLGAGVGFFLFGWKKSVVVDVTEHCH